MRLDVPARVAVVSGLVICYAERPCRDLVTGFAGRSESFDLDADLANREILGKVARDKGPLPPPKFPERLYGVEVDQWLPGETLISAPAGSCS